MTAQPTEPTTSLGDEFARLSDDEQAERMHNAASFTEIPDEQIPGDTWTRRSIRLALELRALSGADCYAYRPAFQPDYVIWDRQPDPATEARFSPRAWAVANGYLSERLDPVSGQWLVSGQTDKSKEGA